ncbi:hypothetical protein FXO38_35432 [Capsicum annuum]|nr:hypothetical protein FXO38_35432 [Capsicum annuum]
MFRDRAMSHYQEHSLFGGSHRLHGCRNGLGFDRQTGMDRGVGVTIGRRAASFFSERLKLKELESEPLLDANGLKSLIRLLRLAQDFLHWYCIGFWRSQLTSLQTTLQLLVFFSNTAFMSFKFT